MFGSLEYSTVYLTDCIFTGTLDKGILSRMTRFINVGAACKDENNVEGIVATNRKKHGVHSSAIPGFGVGAPLLCAPSTFAFYYDADSVQRRFSPGLSAIWPS